MTVLETILIKQALYEPDFPRLKFIEVTDIVATHIAANHFTLGHVVLFFVFIVVIFLLILYFFLYGLTADLMLTTGFDSRPWLEY